MENRTTAPAARRKCTPIPLRGLPPEGEVLATLSIEQLKLAQGVSEEQICPSGEDAAAGGRRGAFPRAPGAVGLFPPPIGRLYGFIYTGGAAAHHNPRAIGASNLSPLRTFGPKGRQPSAAPSEPFEPARPQRAESSRRNQITLSAPHRTVLAVFPHTALRIVLGYHICTRIRGFGI